ncbi:AAA family ATPase [Mycobacterium sp. WMMD1722]|uniref:AAA family ATPase n=1 Tax=Mycobacterium sp. WMMD1722 TaxID=3404117 RepID=UPI003BF5844E
MTDATWDEAEAAREAEALYDERAVTAKWLGQQVFPPLEWIVEGVVPEGFGLLAAPPKAGKSWMVAAWALACAAGGSVFGAVPVKQRPVLYFAMEDGHRRLQSRFRQLMDGDELPSGLEVVTRGSSAECMTMTDEFLRRYGHDAPLVILDTLGKVKPPKASFEDSYAHDYRIGGSLKGRIGDVPGGCLLAVHHTRKAETGDFLDSVSGTQGIAGSADFILVLARKRHASEAILSVTGRDVREDEYALMTHDGRWSLDGMDLLDAAATARRRRESGDLGDRSTEAVAFVNGRPETRPADLAGHLGINGNDAGTYLRRLADAGRIAKRSRGLYGPLSEVFEVSESHSRSDTSDGSDTPFHWTRSDAR